MRGDTARLSGGAAPVNPGQEGDPLAAPPQRPAAADASPSKQVARSGSEKRQRSSVLHVRLTPAEHSHIVGHAERSGLTAASYARQVLLAAPPPRQVRRPPIERQELSRLLGEIGRVGSNLNQLAHAANAGVPSDRSALRRVLESLADVRVAILSALGRRP